MSLEKLTPVDPKDRDTPIAGETRGKTTWADELTVLLQTRCHPVLHLSTDDFHYPQARRYRQGRTSAAGYYADAYDFPALTAYVLNPLGPGGDRRVRPRVHDLESDQPIGAEPIPVPATALVIIDGTFLQKAELDGLWDEMIYIDTDPRIARARAVQRDAALFGGPQAVERIYRTRYHAACALYADDADPVRRAGILIDNNDLNHPFVRRTTDCRD